MAQYYNMLGEGNLYLLISRKNRDIDLGAFVWDGGRSPLRSPEQACGLAGWDLCLGNLVGVVVCCHNLSTVLKVVVVVVSLGDYNSARVWGCASVSPVNYILVSAKLNKDIHHF